MPAQAWVNGIAIVVVVASLVNAWRAIHSPAKRAAKREESSANADAPSRTKHATDAQEHMRWLLLRNEEEIRRREARASNENAGFGDGSSGG